jgi:hypothetical protein
MCSILWWILYIWEALVASFSNLSLHIYALATRGKMLVEKSCIASLEHIPIVKGDIVHFFCIFDFWRWASAEFNRSDRFLEPAWPVWGNWLDRFGKPLDRFMPSAGTCSGWALVCFGGLCSLLELVFYLVASSRCPCLRGPSLFSFKWSRSLPLFGFRSLVSVLLVVSFSFPFFSPVTKCVCYQCTHQGEDWGPCVVRGPEDGRFLVWWVIDNIVWTDSWLSIAGVGCGLTSVSACEEQARKVVACEASRCREDK